MFMNGSSNAMLLSSRRPKCVRNAPAATSDDAIPIWTLAEKALFDSGVVGLMPIRFSFVEPQFHGDGISQCLVSSGVHIECPVRPEGDTRNSPALKPFGEPSNIVQCLSIT